MRCADLPVLQIRYGACSRQELATIDAERSILATLRRAPDLQQRRIEQWEAGAPLSRPARRMDAARTPRRSLTF